MTLPNHIKKLGPCSCINVKYIEFLENSQLQIIDENCFDDALMNEEIILPDSVTKIGKKAFNNCKLKRFIISQNSQLEFIGESAFDLTFISCLFIPKHVKRIDENVFKKSRIQLIAFDEETEIEYFEKIHVGNPYWEVVLLIPKQSSKILDHWFH